MKIVEHTVPPSSTLKRRFDEEEQTNESTQALSVNGHQEKKVKVQQPLASDAKSPPDDKEALTIDTLGNAFKAHLGSIADTMEQFFPKNVQTFTYNAENKKFTIEYPESQTVRCEYKQGVYRIFTFAPTILGHFDQGSLYFDNASFAVKTNDFPFNFLNIEVTAHPHKIEFLEKQQEATFFSKKFGAVVETNYPYAFLKNIVANETFSYTSQPPCPTTNGACAHEPTQAEQLEEQMREIIERNPQTPSNTNHDLKESPQLLKEQHEAK